MKNKVAIVLSGGVVQSVYSDLDEDVEIQIYDLDDWEDEDEAFARIYDDRLSPIF